MRKAITLNCRSLGTLAQVALLNVRKTAALLFFAPAGTLAMSGFVIQSFGH